MVDLSLVGKYPSRTKSRNRLQESQTEKEKVEVEPRGLSVRQSTGLKGVRRFAWNKEERNLSQCLKQKKVALPQEEMIHGTSGGDSNLRKLRWWGS